MDLLKLAKRKKQKREILKADDTKKIKIIKDIKEDETIGEIILSIDDKGKRAQALEKNIDKINSKEILNRIIKTLKDDDILNLLNKDIDHINNEQDNILCTTISNINNYDKKIKMVKKFVKELSDFEISEILSKINDKKGEKKYEDEKIDIISSKLIFNYLSSGTVMHVKDLMNCLEKEDSRLKVLENCLNKNSKFEEKVRYERFNSSYELLRNEGKQLLTAKIMESVYGEKGLERKKSKVILQLHSQEIFDYETARKIIETSVYNKSIRESCKYELLKREKQKAIKEEIDNEDIDR